MELNSILLSISLLFQYATAWTRFDSLGRGGAGLNYVASSSWGPGRMDLFGAANNGQIYYKSFSRGAWSDWENLGGNTQRKPAAFSVQPNRVDVVYTGLDQMLYRRTWNGYAWNNWGTTTNGGIFISGPTMTSTPDDTRNLHVFGVSTDRDLYHSVIDITSDRWSIWENLGGGGLVGDPAAVSWGSNRFDVFGVALDNQIWQKTYDNGWKVWKVLYGGYYKPGLGVASKGPGSINVFGRGLDDSMYHRSFQNGRWDESENVGGQIRGSPSAVSTGSTRVDVFTADESDGVVYHSYSETKTDDDPTNYDCYRGYCWTKCNTTNVDINSSHEWCYTTKGYSLDYKYVSCENFDNCEANWKCAGSCMV